MKSVKLRNGSIEQLVQKELRSRGLRFQRHVTFVRGTPDIVFRAQRLAVFVDGDFWHGWRLPIWEHKLSTFWRKKLDANRLRDRRNMRWLRDRGWMVIRLWEHEVLSDVKACVDRIEARLVSRKQRK